VLGVLMPSPYSSAHSISDALKLADNLGIRTETLPIGDLMKSYDRTLENLFANTTFGIAEENIQSINGDRQQVWLPTVIYRKQIRNGRRLLYVIWRYEWWASCDR
jgi:hypothetical protein